MIQNAKARIHSFICSIKLDIYHQLPLTHCLLFKQGKDKSLKDYTAYFNNKVVRVENYSDVAAMMVGLQFDYSFTKNTLITFTKLLARAHKYSNANELTNTKRSTNLNSQRLVVLG